MKKLISIFLITTLSFSVSLPILANNVSGDSLTDINKPVESQIKDIIENDSLTPEQKEFHIDRMTWATSRKNTRNSMIFDASLNVPYFKQETTYWCGPATARQTIQFLNRTTPASQSQIATSMGSTTAGSDMDQVINYINRNTNYNYIKASANNKENMRMNFYWAMTETIAPPILRIRINNRVGNWTYTTQGHFLNATGISRTGNMVRVTDPYIGWINPSSSGSYWVTFDEVHAATVAHTNQHYAW